MSSRQYDNERADTIIYIRHAMVGSKYYDWKECENDSDLHIEILKTLSITIEDYDEVNRFAFLGRKQTKTLEEIKEYNTLYRKYLDLSNTMFENMDQTLRISYLKCKILRYSLQENRKITETEIIEREKELLLVLEKRAWDAAVNKEAQERIAKIEERKKATLERQHFEDAVEERMKILIENK
jgi:hypothetical protein